MQRCRDLRLIVYLPYAPTFSCSFVHLIECLLYAEPYLNLTAIRVRIRSMKKMSSSGNGSGNIATATALQYKISLISFSFYPSRFPLPLPVPPMHTHSPHCPVPASRFSLFLFVFLCGCRCLCGTADKTDEKFHRRASVKMGVRVIYRTDVFHHHTAPEHCASFAGQHGPCAVQSPPASSTPPLSSESTNLSNDPTSSSTATAGTSTGYGPVFAAAGAGGKSKSKSERGDSFPKLRLSPKSFRFSGRFGRSKSEIEKCPNDPFQCYSKSFQEVSILYIETML